MHWMHATALACMCCKVCTTVLFWLSTIGCCQYHTGPPWHWRRPLQTMYMQHSGDHGGNKQLTALAKNKHT
eukprot:6848-Heterococcus_DN1.PRE.2